MNPVVGDIDGNVERLVALIGRAQTAGAQVIAFPELAITGYPPEDLVLKRSFVNANLAALEKVAAASSDVLMVVGFVDGADDHLFNAAGMCFGGEVVATTTSTSCPTTASSTRSGTSSRGRGHTLIETPTAILGVCVCEDAWFDPGPVISQGDAGAQIVININASPFHKDKLEERTAMLGQRARRAERLDRLCERGRGPGRARLRWWLIGR